MMMLSACNSDGDSTPTLNWDAPLTRVNGSKLFPGEIDSYRVYYRRQDENGFRVRTIDSAGQTSWTPNALKDGTYVFAVATVDTAGLESPRSETLRVTIP